MASWTTIGFNLGIRSIEAAYKTSREAFEKELDKLAVEWDQYVREFHLETERQFDYGDHLSDLHAEAETGLKLLREAFALVVYHYWEKEACSLFCVERYNQDDIFAKAKKSGQIHIDELGINRLRLIANTIKHDSGKTLWKEDPGLFGGIASQLGEDDMTGWHRFLQLRDDDVIKGIAAVKASAPSKDWKSDGDIEIIDDDK